jgi:putative flippase GtrA
MSHSFGSSSAEVLPAPIAPPEASAAFTPAIPVVRAPGGKVALLQQFLKFCVVGASSTVISLSVVYFLIKIVHLKDVLFHMLAGYPWLQQLVHGNELFVQVAGTFGFIFGLINSFYWNSRWTFPQNNVSERRQQYFKFFAVNIVGLVLNWLVTFVLMQLMKHGQEAATGLQVDVAIFGAIFVVSFWNFTANKFWTFKH